MGTMKQPLTFISYSRKQLYFAESLALHLQKEGLDIWFDLQQLQAGTKWAKGLSDGVQSAKRMVLVVSQASLESPYTQQEWQGFTEKGHQLILAIYEPVTLPDSLKGLPTYDFRGEFNSKMSLLVAFLRGEKEALYDSIPSVNHLGVSTKLPIAIWLTLLAHFGSFIICLFSFFLSIALRPAEFVFPTTFFWLFTAFSFIVGAWNLKSFLQHTLEFEKIKQVAGINLWLLIPAFFVVGQIGNVALISDTPTDITLASQLYRGILITITLLMLFVRFYSTKRSAGLLRWMRAEESSQNLRRAVHQPLIAKAAFDVDIAASRDGKALAYTLHADSADQPFAQWVNQIFKKEGHQLVTTDEQPEQNIALLSNRSSGAWVQKITQSHAGNLIFIVISTIDFKESLTETGQYQWVDARSADKQDIKGLARSLANIEMWKREAAIEVTPAMIDRWKVPNSISALKRMLELFAIYILVFGLTDLIGFMMGLFGILTGSDGNVFRSVLLIAMGVACFWLSSKALIYRKVSARWVYALLAASVILVAWFGNVLPLFLASYAWLFSVAALLLLMHSARNAYFWFPASQAKVQQDEVGINQNIEHSFKRRNFIIVAAWIIFIAILPILLNIQKRL